MFGFPPILSRFSGQISADPAFATGMTLISWAVRMSLALVVVKSDLRLTFQWVVSQINAWMEKMLPDHTNVHSDDCMCFSYRSGER